MCLISHLLGLVLWVLVLHWPLLWVKFTVTHRCDNSVTIGFASFIFHYSCSTSILCARAVFSLMHMQNHLNQHSLNLFLFEASQIMSFLVTPQSMHILHCNVLFFIANIWLIVFNFISDPILIWLHAEMCRPNWNFGDTFWNLVSVKDKKNTINIYALKNIRNIKI